MVGKPNFAADVDARDDIKGSSVGTPGLTALDEEREASLADEGGASGAVIESQDLESRRRIVHDLPVAHLQPEEPLLAADEAWAEWSTTALIATASFLGAALGVLAFRRWAR
jgi:hypothetical protein